MSAHLQLSAISLQSSAGKKAASRKTSTVSSVEPLKTESSKRGFTLVELLIAISIIAIISAVGITSYSQAQKLGRDFKRKQDLRSIATALELYHQKYKRYPVTNSTGGWYQLSNTGEWIFDKGAVGVTPSAASGNIAPTFISALPTDPINDNSYHYSYYGWPSDWHAPECKAGQYYFLVAGLENTNDPDLHCKKKPLVCGIDPGWCPAPPATSNL